MSFEEYLASKGKSELTIKTYTNEISLFKEWFINSYGISFSNMNRINFLEYKNYLKKIKSYAGKTINKKIASLALFNDYLVEVGLSDKNIILKSDYLKIQNNTFSLVRLSKENVENLRQIILDKNDLRLYLAITLLAYSGLRISELVNLKVSEVLLKERLIYVVGKGDKFRKIPLNQKVEIALKEYYRKNNLTNEDYIFKSRKGGHISKNVINRGLKKYTNKIKPHSLRHYFAFRLIDKLSIHEVASILGHSSLDTTLKYLRADRKEIKQRIYEI